MVVILFAEPSSDRICIRKTCLVVVHHSLLVCRGWINGPVSDRVQRKEGEHLRYLGFKL